MICRHCGKPVVDGDARYTAGEPEHYAHWDCHDRARKSLPEMARRFSQMSDDARGLIKHIERNLYGRPNDKRSKE